MDDRQPARCAVYAPAPRVNRVIRCIASSTQSFLGVCHTQATDTIIGPGCTADLSGTVSSVLPSLILSQWVNRWASQTAEFFITTANRANYRNTRRLLYRALILLSLALFRAPLCLRSSWCYICIKKFLCLHPSLYLLVSCAWWDWPLIWLTNRHPSVLWHCQLGFVIWPVKSSPKWPIMCRVGR